MSYGVGVGRTHVVVNAQRSPPITSTDPSLLEQLTVFHDQSWGWALHCCRQHEDEAREVLQEAYGKVARRPDGFAGTSSLRTWFFGVIRLTALEECRRWVRWRRMGDTADLELRASNDPSQRLVQEEEVQLFQAMLDELPQRQREVLHLVFYQDLTVEQAAAVMQVSLGTARQHYHRGKQALRRLLATAKGAEHHDSR